MRTKRLWAALLFFSLLLSGCTPGNERLTPNDFLSILQNDDRFPLAVQELENSGQDRFYVALEEKESADSEKEKSTGTQEKKELILVTYVSKSSNHEEMESELLFSLLQDYGFRLIYFQTARDGRRCILFSLEEESESFVQGIYYSFDAQPCAWWGRQAELKKKDDRYLQLSENGNAWYYTLPLKDGFYYFEKQGSLVA